MTPADRFGPPIDPRMPPPRAPGLADPGANVRIEVEGLSLQIRRHLQAKELGLEQMLDRAVDDFLKTGLEQQVRKAVAAELPTIIESLVRRALWDAEHEQGLQEFVGNKIREAVLGGDAKKCEGCRKPFFSTRADARFCGNHCRWKAQKRAQRKGSKR